MVSTVNNNSKKKRKKNISEVFQFSSFDRVSHFLNLGFLILGFPQFFGYLHFFHLLPFFHLFAPLGPPLYGAGCRKDFSFCSLGHFPPAFCWGMAGFLQPWLLWLCVDKPFCGWRGGLSPRARRNPSNRTFSAACLKHWKNGQYRVSQICRFEF